MRSPRKALFSAFSIAPLLFAHAARATTCSQVTFRSVKHVNGRTYQLFGQGFPIEVRGRLLVAPFHVVGDADEVYARCGNVEFPVRVLSRSTTADVAILKVPPSIVQRHLLVPVPLDSSPPWSPFQGPRIDVSRPGAEDQPSRLVAAVGVPLSARYIFPVMGPADGLMLGGAGVRPGMSGSRVEDASGQTTLGMVVLTQTFGQMSIAVPSWDILALAQPQWLSSGRDPYAGPSNPAAAYATSNLQPSPDGHFLQRLYSLHLRPSPGQDIVLRETCPSNAYLQTSQWEQTGGDYAQPGDYARPGSESDTLPDGSVFVDALSSVSPQVAALTGLTELGGSEVEDSYFVPGHEDCGTEGVILPDGRRLVGLKNQDVGRGAPGVIRIDSVERLYQLARLKGPQTWNEILTNGIFAKTANSPGDSMDVLCGSDALRGQDSVSEWEEPKSCAPVIINGEPAELRTVTMFLRPIASLAIQGSSPPATLSCDPASGTLNLRSADRGALPTRFDLSISADHVQGQIRIGNCVMPVDQPKDFWEAELQDPDMDLMLSYQNMAAGAALVINVRSIDEKKCLAGTPLANHRELIQSFTWTTDFEMYDQFYRPAEGLR